MPLSQKMTSIISAETVTYSSLFTIFSKSLSDLFASNKAVLFGSYADIFKIFNASLEFARDVLTQPGGAHGAALANDSAKMLDPGLPDVLSITTLDIVKEVFSSRILITLL